MGAVAFGSPEEFRAVLTGEAGAIGRDPLIPPDDARHIAAWSRLSHFDLVAVVSSPTEDILAAWRAALPPRLLASLLASGVILAISLWLLSSLKGLSRAREEIASSLDRMRESDALKNRLLSIIAHDLRGPVGATANLLEILEAEGEAMDTEDRSRLLATLRASSASTRQLLENLLEWARLQTEAAVRPPRPTGLQPLVEECVHLLGPSAAAKALALDISVEPGLEARIDAERFRILVRNLLSNAIKFSRIGGRIRLRARAIEGTALIQVEDEGVGMGSSELDRLFAASEGGRSRAGTAGESGSGLGLVLCKDIVEGLGGAIAVESEEGRGTRFSIRLPST
jgi:signal transduction histidine kinase